MKCQLINNSIFNNYGIELLKERGVENIDLFLSPTADCRQVDGLENLQAGAELLTQIINKDGTICIIVDCDVDGYTSAAIIYQYIKNINNNIKIDYKLHEGKQHGLEDQIQELLEQEPYDLVICPDSSSNDYQYHELLKEMGTRVLVLDHHLVDSNISTNTVIINNQYSPNYKNKDLTGAGVVYQFCKYLDKYLDYDFAKQYIDLAALGIIGDMGNVLSIENRYFIKEGLSNIQNFFFKTLIDKQSYSMGGKVTPITVAFYIVPMINAMIRVGTQEEKKRLFQAFINGEELIPSQKRGAKGQLEKVAVESARECTNARSKQNKILDKIEEQLETKIFKHDLLSNKILFIKLEDEDFPPELNGLAAMRISAKYKHPTIVARLNNKGYIRGSARGINDSELTDFRQFLLDSHLFEYAQGHANAFGASVYDKDLKKFHDYANEKLQNIDFNENVYKVNFERFSTDSDIQDLITDLSNYEELWGTGNDTPLIHIKSIKLFPNDIQIIGARKDTVKFMVNGVTYIQFHAKKLIDDLQNCKNINLEIVGTANLNEWMGNLSPQIFIKNYEIKEEQITDF